MDRIIHNGRSGEVYNVGGHNERKNIEIVKMICAMLLIQPKYIMSWDVFRKQNLRMASRKQYNGIWIIVSGGRP